MTFSNIDIEDVFGDYVEASGGVVSDRVPSQGNKARNADYIFHDDKIVAELKSLKEEPLMNKDFVKSFNNKTKEWIEKGYVSIQQLQRVTKIYQFPVKCYNDIVKLYMRPIKYHVETANKQIKATKERLGLPDYKGLILVASDGNYFLEPRHVRYFLSRVLDNETLYKAINTAIYFTANVVTTRPDDPSISRLWVQLYRDKEHFESVPLSFLQRLYNGWVIHYQEATGIKLKNIVEMNEEGITETDVLEETRFLRPPKTRSV